MNALKKALHACKDVEDVSRTIHHLVYDPLKLDAFHKDKNVHNNDDTSADCEDDNDKPSKISLACRLHHASASLHDLSLEPNKRAAVANAIRYVLESDHPHDDRVRDDVFSMHAGATDGCFEIMPSLGGGGSAFRLPPVNWHQFRKGYSILMWIKPLIADDDGQENEKDGFTKIHKADVAKSNDSDMFYNQMHRTLYRFRSFATRGKYVDASLTSPFELYNGENIVFQGTLVAEMCITSFDPLSSSDGSMSTNTVHGKLHLVPGVWQLLAFTHSCPYLKKPQITVSVNGNVMIREDLHYPAPDDSIYMRTKGDLMEDSVLLENIIEGSNNIMQSCRISSINIYGAELPQSVLSSVSESGPNSSFDGNILQPSPSVPLNKYSSKSLPSSLVYDFIEKAVHTYHPLFVSSRSASSSNRTSQIKQFCANSASVVKQMGTFEGLRVAGFVKPRIISKEHNNKQHTDMCWIYGSIEVRVPTQFSNSCQNIQNSWYIVNGIEACLLPLCLSIPPPASIFQHLEHIKQSSDKNLYSLLSQKADLMCSLLKLFGVSVRLSPAIRDEVIQRGLVFVMFNLLRRVLLRARQKSRGSSQNVVELDDLNIIESIPVPEEIAKAVSYVLKSCCGVTCVKNGFYNNNEGISHGLMIRRTSDIAEQALHGIGLDFSLKSSIILREIQALYCDQRFNTSLTQRLGRFIRMKMTVETLLGMIKIHFLNDSSNRDRREQIIFYLSSLLALLLRASLSDANSITAAERDVAACVNILKEHPLGSLSSGVVLTSLLLLMDKQSIRSTEDLLVEQRLARNLSIVHYHDCVGPVILGRILKRFSNSPTGVLPTESTSWQKQWCQALIIFVWMIQLMKEDEETERLSRSVGKWLIASADAGALEGVCLNSVQNESISDKLGVETNICSIFGGEHLYETEKRRRLRASLYVVPALVSSLLRDIQLTEVRMNDDSTQKMLDSTKLTIESLTCLLASIAAAIKSTGDLREKRSKRENNLFFSSVSDDRSCDWGEFSSISIMLKIVNKLEVLIQKEKGLLEGNSETDWVNMNNSSDVLQQIEACQDLAIDACSTIITKTSKTEGANLWQAWSSVLNCLTADESFFASVTNNTIPGNNPLEAIKSFRSDYTEEIFSRLAIMVINQTLRGSVPSADDSHLVTLVEVADAMVPLVNVIAEHQILPKSKIKHVSGEQDSNGKVLTDNQRLLLSLIIRFLEKGRDELGWCSFDEHRQSLLDEPELEESSSDTSRVLLPLLRPCFTILLDVYACALYSLPPPLLNSVVKELKLTVTAAIVGVHPLSTARDIAMEALSALRLVDRLIIDEKDKRLVSLRSECLSLFSFVSNELRVRLHNDRKIRREFLNTFFPEGEDRNRSTSYDATDRAAHELLESVILGTDSPLVPIQPKENNYFKSNTSENENINHSLENNFGMLELERILGIAFASSLIEGANLRVDNKRDRDLMLMLKDELDSYEVDSESFREDLRMLYMVERSSSQRMELLDHVDAVDNFLAQTRTSSENQTTPPDALQYRRIVRCTAHSDGLAFKFLSDCLNMNCEEYLQYYERTVSDAGATGAYSRLPTYPNLHMSSFDRSLPQHFFGSEGDTDERSINNTETENIKKAATLVRKSSLMVRDITKINIDGEEESISDTSTGNDEESVDSNKSLKLDFEWNERSFDDDTNRSLTDATSSSDVTSSPTKVESNIFSGGSRYESICCPGDGSFSSGGTGRVLKKQKDILHVRAEGSRSGTLLLTNNHLIIEYNSEYFDGELLYTEETKQRYVSTESSEIHPCKGMAKIFLKGTAPLRPRSLRWDLAEMSSIFLRRFRLRDSALEIFFMPSAGNGNFFSPSMSSIFIDFGSGRTGNARRDDLADLIMRLSPNRCIKQWPDKHHLILQDAIRRAQNQWVNGRLSNFDYLLELNRLSGRTFNDLCQYPVMPWVLSNYSSNEVPDLTNRDNFRNLSLPIGALNAERLADCLERFESFYDQAIPPFMYGSHYSTSAGVVLHFLVRLHPFAALHRQLQNGHFDVADRLFSSVARTWEMCIGSSAAEVKELTPEWYSNPSFLQNRNNFRLGSSQDGDIISDVTLPPWANGSPEKFIEVMRCALESDICTENLPNWIDLIFGFKQTGPEARKANNVFFYLTYYGSIDVASIENEADRSATELQIAHFGQCPMKLFKKPHPQKKKRCPYTGSYGTTNSSPLQRIYASNDAHCKDSKEEDNNQRRPISNLPFVNAPLSHWVHIDSPPPGPHSHLISIRLVGDDRCVAVDMKGVFHSFRWVWKAETLAKNNDLLTIDKDNGDFNLKPFQDDGCFIAQRELHSFRNVPRLPNAKCNIRAISLSRSLISGLVLVLSDGNGKGALSIQFVDPSKGYIKSEALIPFAHSDAITVIKTVSLTSSSLGDGELAIVGSRDSTASLWRIRRSEALSLRPKLRFSGHSGEPIFGADISISLNVCMTVSRKRCCIHSLSNGMLLRTICPPTSPGIPFTSHRTIFANSDAIVLGKRGHLVLPCQSFCQENGLVRKPVVTLQLFSLEGCELGSCALESWRGIPNRMITIADDTMIMVAAIGGVTIHRLSTLSPLEYVDEWRVFDDPTLIENATVFDIDLGPVLSRPVIAAAACSAGAVRLHALPGITKFSEDAKKNSAVAMVGGALAKPAKSIKKVVGNVTGIGSRFVGFGSELGKEAISDVKDKGFGGFLGNVYDKAKSAVSRKGN